MYPKLWDRANALYKRRSQQMMSRQSTAEIFTSLVQNRQPVIDAVIGAIQAVPDEHNYAQNIRHIEEDLSAVQKKPPAGDEYRGRHHHGGVQAAQRQTQRAGRGAGYKAGIRPAPLRVLLQLFLQGKNRTCPGRGKVASKRGAEPYRNFPSAA